MVHCVGASLMRDTRRPKCSSTKAFGYPTLKDTAGINEGSCGCAIVRSGYPTLKDMAGINEGMTIAGWGLEGRGEIGGKSAAVARV